MRAVVVQHVPFEGPGLIAPLLAAAGVEVDVVRVYRNEPLPEDFDVLVVMGGPMGALDDREHPNLAAERDLIARSVRRGRPVLGVCLGAQLLATALGALLVPGADFEIGAGTVELTPDGVADPVLGPAGPSLPVVHWHQDTFELPENGVLLASTDRYPNQAFRVGESYGFQFHVELDADALAQIEPHLPDDVVVSPEDLRPISAAGEQVLVRWIDHALSAVARP
ncbi:gamma-glutamyl-gamma-aminobutyrate hydrolase family protein [Actinosynnema sp. NPDC020468]|uniref:type 1 glutamine amidotransferase n=1 Tax=Actinosynnema sp. NPDC020468 TaxID=3154488 RepID=UPI0033C9B582